MTTIKFKKFNIEAYQPGKSTIKSFNKIIKLSANESALGVSASRIIWISKKYNFSFIAYFFNYFRDRNFKTFLAVFLKRSQFR